MMGFSVIECSRGLWCHLKLMASII